jgi:hypothetical protein
VGLSMAERKAVTKQMARRYQGASKAEKGKMLDELCALTGWTRSSRPQGSCPGALGSRRVSAATTAQDLRARCRGAAAARVGGARRPGGKRLAPFMTEALGAPGTSRGARVLWRGPRQAASGLGGEHRSPARSRASSPAGAGTLGDQAGLDPEPADPHPHLRRVGRSPSRVLRGRPGSPRRRRSPRRVLPDARSCLRGNGVDRATRPSQQGPAMGPRGAGGHRRDPAVPPSGAGLGQRCRVHQRPAPFVVPGAADHLHPVPALPQGTTTASSSRRTGRSSASRWATCATTPPKSSPS